MDGRRLIPKAGNDFDSNGLALRDEFSDAISAYISQPIDGAIEMDSVTVFP